MISALLNPALLTFIFGIVIGNIFKNRHPSPLLSKYFGYYLLLGLGLKGGLSLQKTGLTNDVVTVLTLGIFFAFLIPIISYFYLKNILNSDDAAALAGTYGSVSAVTFVTANTYLATSSQIYDNYMTAVLVVMEFPAIFMALYLVTKSSSGSSSNNLKTIKTAFLETPNVILIVSFLFVMGLRVSKRMHELSGKSYKLITFALVTPILGALLALVFSIYFGLNIGNTTLLMVLTASASYIAVPAVVKDAIPNANPAIYLGLSLGVTFPFNVIIGIPVYNQLAILLLP